MKTTPYAYCANNPTNLIDPDGEEIWALGKGTFNFGSEGVVETQRLYVWVTNGLQGYFEHLDFTNAYDKNIVDSLNVANQNVKLQRGDMGVCIRTRIEFKDGKVSDVVTQMRLDDNGLW
ncbi:MAG: hypothetical protein J6K74_03990 [Marinifilaceae bacterium]|nr:hypothetical protein [Marinifilaceae bacterium]